MAATLTTSESTSHRLPITSATNSMRLIWRILLAFAAVIVTSVLIWQGMATAGAPDPTVPNTGRWAATFDIGVLVFREGLECVLVLAAITASMTGDRQAHRRPVAIGAAVGFIATLITWFIAIGIVHSLAGSLSALDLQAGTGLLAVIVLLVVMNWFFHKIYWGGWIAMHNRKKKKLLGGAPNSASATLVWGLALLGFASFYREGFEVVLFLQSYYLKMGGRIVLGGAALGLFLSGIVAVLTFFAHRRLPYRKMLVLTGIMLGVVLLVMVGEQAQEMQQAGWIPTTRIPSFTNCIPAWMGLWFSIFPTVETLLAQLTAVTLVAGSYFVSKTMGKIAS
jgi:high-affinity iron transporter